MPKSNQLDFRLKAWISASRPRTLFLAFSVALCGNAIAFSTGNFNILVFILTSLLTLALQLLSNLSNDLGDFEHGTDITGNRIGPQRALQSKAITAKAMKRAIYFCSLLCAVIGISLLYHSLQFINIPYIIVLTGVGIACIFAAIKYTSGKNPYGYKGWGDFFSFLFFGPVAIIGTYFLHTGNIDFIPVLPSISLGLLTASVLNINNIRDIENDEESGKITIPVRIGLQNAKHYHSLLNFAAFFCLVIYNILYANYYYQTIYMVVFLFFFGINYKIYKTSEKKDLDPYLKQTALTTFLLSLLFSICINL